MNDRGIRRSFPLYARFCLNMRLKGRVLMVYIALDHYTQGFLTFKVGKTQFQGLCLLPLSRALGQLSKYDLYPLRS